MSRQAVSDWPCGISGHILSRSGPSSSDSIDAAARIHPVDVAAHGVDLAVMGDEAVGMRQLPGREGVGGEALMHQRQRRCGQRIAQVVVEAADLRRQQQALVDHRARREGRHVEIAQRRQAAASRPASRSVVLGLLADGQQLALERVLVLDRRARARRSPGGSPASSRARVLPRPVGSVGTSRQPSSVWPSTVMKCSNCLMAIVARLGVARQEAHRHGVVARAAAGSTPVPRAQSRSSASGIWIRQPAPSPTSGSAPDRAAMVEIDQDLQALRDDVVRLSALDVGDKADAARSHARCAGRTDPVSRANPSRMLFT